VGDLSQLPPLRDKPLYVGNTTGKVLWIKFNNFATLATIFLQQGKNDKQYIFHRVLNKIRNAKHILEDLEFLMSWVDMRLHPRERDLFDSTVNMFPTNNLLSFHNIHMLKSLNSAIA